MDFRYPWARAPGASRSVAARKEVQCIAEVVLAEELEEEKKNSSARCSGLYR